MPAGTTSQHQGNNRLILQNGDMAIHRHFEPVRSSDNDRIISQQSTKEKPILRN